MVNNNILLYGASRSGALNSQWLMKLCEAWLRAYEHGFLGTATALSHWIADEWQFLQKSQD